MHFLLQKNKFCDKIIFTHKKFKNIKYCTGSGCNPKDNFITEERNPNNKVDGRTWVIDPIDGTVAFIKGLPTWGMQLAFVDNNITQFAIIYLPKDGLPLYTLFFITIFL